MFGFIIDIFCKDTVTGLSLFDVGVSSDKSNEPELYVSDVLMPNLSKHPKLHKAYKDLLFETKSEPQRLFKNKYGRLFGPTLPEKGLEYFTDPIVCHL